MTFFLCKLWPYLAGGLIGWLLAGWFARRLKHVEPPVEKLVEKQVDKIVDNPEHLALIGKLEGENNQIPDLLSRVASFESAEAKTVEKIVEKKIDNPDHLARIKELEKENKEIAKLRGRIKSFENQQSQSAGADNNPELLARIKELEAENGQISGLQGKIKAFESVDTKSAVGKTVEVEKLIDNPTHIQRISELESQINDLKHGPAIDLKAARAAGIVIKNEKDFAAIEGIGPKINDLIHADGIQSFASLADTQPSNIQTILDNGGSSYKMANPGTWPDQANLAANNRWGALKALQDVLDGGVYPDSSASANKSKNSKSANAAKKDKSKTAGKPSVQALDLDAAKAAGFKVKQKNRHDDFTIVEGIGPKINDLIHDDGIHTFSELGKTLVEDIQKILDKAGSNYKLAKPSTWPAQADMAASNKWKSLKAWQDELDGGEES